MVKFEVTSAKECSIDGLGTFAAGETKQVTDTELRHFKALHGRTLAEANFPPYILVVALTNSEGGN